MVHPTNKIIAFRTIFHYLKKTRVWARTETMGYTIVFGTKPSPVTLRQNHAILSIENVLIKCQNYQFKENKNKVGWCWGYPMNNWAITIAYFSICDLNRVFDGCRAD